ncbi:MAG: hypothetical protein QHC67_10225 [Sphingobium sp.]|uniref:hypothetical protein n=1 Tax=Sphingobium sp. TaxID=1912891 RepID=UPI0029BE698E|nr:hypothetical protein [Sphingobium sp.]MDX3910181.1 hypothetical protein [Sphingobium sp.]
MGDDNIIDMRTRLVDGADLAQARDALRARHAEYAIHRRALLQGDHSLVKRDPRDMASAIALGFTLVRIGLRAKDSWRLEGLLNETVDEVVERLLKAASHFKDQNTPVGLVLVRALDLGAYELMGRGEYEAWRRRALRYFEEHEAWLAAEPELRESGAWRDRRMSTDQQEMIRATCALIEIDLPGQLLRGSAHDWLSSFRASLTYRGAGA